MTISNLDKLSSIALVGTVVLSFLATDLLLLSPQQVITAESVPAEANYGQGGSLEEQRDELRNEIERVKREREQIENSIEAERSRQDGVNSEISIVARERELIQSEIDEKQLLIDELNLDIEILERDIENNEQVIEVTELEVAELTEKTDEQLTDMYLDIKTYNSSLTMIFSDASTDIVKTGLYKQTIQDETNALLLELKTKREKLQATKDKLEDDRDKIEEDRIALVEEESLLEGKRQELQTKLGRLYALFNESKRSINAGEEAYASLSEREQELTQELERVQRQIISSIGAGSDIPDDGNFVIAGTVIGIEGNTGVSTGPHLHFEVHTNGYAPGVSSPVNPCTRLPRRQLANATCGVDSPLLSTWPMGGTPWFTGGFRTHNRPTHNGIDVSTGGGAPIIAAHDGWVFYGNDNACSWYNGQFPCNGVGANFAKLCENPVNNCASGLVTVYLHLAD